ncbi:MAG TPA: response regulator [Verrucomicrobiae bacterium]|nr:response regulator [Verrucomicrobiae bacterium]
MKKQIFLEFSAVQPFDRIEIGRSAARSVCGSHPTRMCQLDRPPNGDTILNALNARTAVALTENRHNHSRHILVVEDEADLRQIYSKVLVRSGYQVDTAEDGEAGWKVLYAAYFSSSSYDLLITDNKMPKLSGVELIHQVHSARLELPVILASGIIPVNTDQLHLAAILPKPFSPHQLTQTVQQVLHLGKDE